MLLPPPLSGKHDHPFKVKARHVTELGYALYGKLQSLRQNKIITQSFTVFSVLKKGIFIKITNHLPTSAVARRALNMVCEDKSQSQSMRSAQSSVKIAGNEQATESD